MARSTKPNIGTKTKVGPNKWRLTVTVESDPFTNARKRKSKRVYAESETQADRLLREFHYEARNKDNYGGKKTVQSLMLENYIDHKKYVDGLRARTIESYESIINNHVLPYMGHMDVKEITTSLVDKWIIQLRKKGLSAKTTLNCFNVLNNALNQSFVWDMVEKKPLDRMNRPKVPPTSRNTASFKEVAAILRRAAKDEHWYVPTWMASYTAMRRQEIFGLRWSDIHLDKGYLKSVQSLQIHKGPEILIGPNKNHEEKIIELGDITVDILKQWKVYQDSHREYDTDNFPDFPYHPDSLEDRSVEELVFLEPDGYPIRPSSFTGYLRKIGKQLNFPNITGPHSLRHAHATMAREMGVSIEVISQRLGHTTIKTTSDMYGTIPSSLQKPLADELEVVLLNAENDLNSERMAREWHDLKNTVN